MTGRITEDLVRSQRHAKKPFFKKLYEGVVEGIADIFENRKEDRVATVVSISGPVADPDSSVWQILGKLWENAFIRAILPGFEREITVGRKKR